MLPLPWRPARPADWPRLRQLLAKQEAAWLSLIDRLENAAPWWHRGLWVLEPLPGSSSLNACFYLNDAGLAIIAADPQGSAELYLEELLLACRKALSKLYCLIGLTEQVQRLQPLLRRQPLADTPYALMARASSHPLELPQAAGRGQTAQPGTWPIRADSGFSWRGLEFRRATEQDTDALLELQCQYEVEEVLVPGHAHKRQLSRQLLSVSLREQCLFCAGQGGQMVAKAGTNGHSWNLVQIGGVYTLPGWRNHGIGEHLMQALLAEIQSHGLGSSLFVKKRNLPALRLYDKLGFEPSGELSIAYY